MEMARGDDREQNGSMERLGMSRVADGYWERVEAEASKGTSKTWDKKAMDEWHPAVVVGCSHWRDLAGVASNALREGHAALWLMCVAKAEGEAWKAEFERCSAEFFISATFGRSPDSMLKMLMGCWEAPWGKGAGEAFLAACIEAERTRGVGRTGGVGESVIEALAGAPGALGSLAPARLEFALSKLAAPLAAKIRTRFESDQIRLATGHGAALGKSSGPKQL